MAKKKVTLQMNPKLDEGTPVESTDFLVDVHKTENVFSEDLSVDWGETLLETSHSAAKHPVLR